jgi:putative methyltransferase (TIGR01177 family)
MYIFQISQENVELAKYEIISLLNVSIKHITENIYYTKDEFNLNLLSRLAYTKNVFKKILSTKNLDKINYNKFIKNTYKLDMLNYANKCVSFNDVANLIFSKLKQPKVNIKNPKNIYTIIELNDKFIITKKILENTEDFNLRKSHNRKFNYPTSLNPKLAKAVINLVCKKSFIDPFCGAGGILLEGKIMNLDVNGSDISEKMIYAAKENLKQFNFKAKLNVKDALKINKKYESIVTDMPFGKNSILSKEINLLYKEFIFNSQKITDKMVLGHNSTINIKPFLKNTGWKLVKEFNFYVHKSMTRTISVLIKKNN